VCFLVVVLPFTVLGVVVTFKKKRFRANSLILAIYPFLFHCCFLVFYWVKSYNLLVVTQLICLGVFLLGSIHHTLTICCDIVYAVVKLIRKLCKNNKIEPTKTNFKEKNKKTEFSSSLAAKVIESGERVSFAEEAASKKKVKVKSDRLRKTDRTMQIYFKCHDF
jgi:hypothetical protein